MSIPVPDPARMSVSDTCVRPHTCRLLNPSVERWRCRRHPGLNFGGTVCTCTCSGVHIRIRIGARCGSSRLIGSGTSRAEEEGFPEPSTVLFWVVIVRFICYVDLSSDRFNSRNCVKWTFVSKSVNETHALCATLVDLTTLTKGVRIGECRLTLVFGVESPPASSNK